MRADTRELITQIEISSNGGPAARDQLGAFLFKSTGPVRANQALKSAAGLDSARRSLRVRIIQFQSRQNSISLGHYRGRCECASCRRMIGSRGPISAGDLPSHRTWREICAAENNAEDDESDHLLQANNDARQELADPATRRTRRPVLTLGARLISIGVACASLLKAAKLLIQQQISRPELRCSMLAPRRGNIVAAGERHEDELSGLLSPAASQTGSLGARDDAVCLPSTRGGQVRSRSTRSCSFECIFRRRHGSCCCRRCGVQMSHWKRISAASLAGDVPGGRRTQSNHIKSNRIG